MGTQKPCIYSTFRCFEVHYWRAVRPTPQEFHDYNLYLIAKKSAVIPADRKNRSHPTIETVPC
ncbi:MAG: hypothetical protein F6K62_15750 [Sphaerospermopsis sp. SIO1G2]|nr:hypothetical protein [Sphaerospermopsis sp. SIO1G1]NET72328.1 hypothetical protein [Sphaerospermopsis sp. SIO1G2]